MHPKLLLVGQDWWHLEDKFAHDVLENVKAINSGATYNCNEGMKPSCKTDENLIELFASLDYGYDDIFHKSYDDLFFTNICLGYRSKGASGGLKTEFINRDIGYFKNLVSILEPKVSICLEKETFKGVMRSFDIYCNMNNASYNEFISHNNPQSIVLENGRIVQVFAMAHCGAIGTMNRNRGTSVGKDKLILQKKDWSAVKKYLV